MKLDDKELLIALYLAYFGRPMRYYDEIIFSHLKGDQNISNSFSTLISSQSEFHHSYSDEKHNNQKINDLYNNLFCRDVDDSGLIYWSKLLNSKGIEFLAHDLIYATYQLTLLNDTQAVTDYKTLMQKIKVCNFFSEIIRNNNQYIALYKPVSFKPWISGRFIDEIKSFFKKVDSTYQPSFNILCDFIKSSSYEISDQVLSPAIILKNISLDIPILGSESRNLKRSIINSLTGGALSKKRGLMTVKALANLNLSINKGERVALIGHNGSGKSCLLRLISGIYKPSLGSINVETDVYPMIQKSFLTSVELSGVDAAKAFYLMSNNRKKDYQEYLDDILEFSGLGSYIYLPIRTYSDGMSARLLFSLLTSFNHDCLVIDEGFGTGDTNFYEKAEKRMKSFIDQTGTLILASHSEELLNKFCDRGIVLSKGSLVFDGSLSHALTFYHNYNYDLV